MIQTTARRWYRKPGPHPGELPPDMRLTTLLRPRSTDLQTLLGEQVDLDFTYTAIGATRRTPPSGFTVDHRRALLGRGEATWRRARQGLEAWRPYDADWLMLYPERPALAAGSVVAVCARAQGLWFINCTRLIEVFDELDTDGAIHRFGFLYGTLPAHAECGEERFTVEWHRASDEVWFDIFAFSRPRHVLARIAPPLARRAQGRFARDAMHALRTFCESEAAAAQ